MRVSVFTDELSADIDTALELAEDLGLEAVDLRGVGSSRYPRVSPLLRKHVPTLLREYRVEVITISPGLFKIPYPAPISKEARALRWDHALSYSDWDAAERALHMQVTELLPLSIEAAVEVGAQAINCFSFDRAGAPSDASAPAAAVETLRSAADLAAAASLKLLIENEATCWGSTAASTAMLLEAIQHPAIALTWDPANAFKAGDDRPFPDGYARIKSYVAHVHFKDARFDKSIGSRAFAYDGILDWAGQIKALTTDAYAGAITVETHQRPKVATTRRYVQRLQALLAEQASEGS